MSDGGQRYVIAAIEYVTRYAVAVTVARHTAQNVAEFLMRHVVLRFGPFRELLTDGAPELTGSVIEQLVMMLQAQQTNPVPYRPQMVGLVERFHRTWKDCVSTYMNEDRQHDWDVWVDCAVYAYNSGPHSTVQLSPNELMMGRRLRSPNELIRSTSVAEAGELTAYHQRLLAALRSSQECADRARQREQQRQARYYDRKVKQKRTFEPGDRVWMYRPPRGPKASKFVHQWAGPMRIVETAGYDNYLLEREDKTGECEQLVAHVSFLVTYRYPVALLREVVADLEAQLEHEGAFQRQAHDASAGEIVGATTAPTRTAAAGRDTKRTRRTVASAGAPGQSGGLMVESRRRRRRNKAGHYVLEYELQPLSAWGRRRRAPSGAPRRDGTDGSEDERQWVSVKEYDRLLQLGRVVDRSAGGEGV
ncbi:hypothetical protein PF005_g18158 [Phytophthora fragariae]|uniref:Integrase catalytic domain-containing protein n=1 Tax=Phytophthora fragariae TaxID=53985 RepID=A0A6A3EKR3_9STRA|nr:hypothetical protein PF009_g18084 [Phytophthora fragariae]KAE8997279.1 hypothetical protein PF011_g15554 [Phytophthora fragariae]KAE9092887.1 hypothetical protein PF010_g17695 [Phytophthora fragariae]KAE9093541.1 hypothetical protein PF007_g18097 [Phytophthora fragariae]KAE9130154.1 hypothetical protein PF006_g15833 [Phytophthora fragariae]